MKATFRALLSLLAAGAMLPACGGSQNAAMPQSVETQSRADGTSGSYGDLLFTSGLLQGQDAGKPLLFSYPSGRFINYIGGVYGGSGMCSDKRGNVWEASGQVINRFNHHGGYLGSLKVPSGTAWSCAVDPTTGNIAVMSPQSGGILVYQGSGSPTLYATPSFTSGWFCGYDTDGNLFADGTDSSGQGQLVELQKGAQSVTPIYVDHTIVGSGAVQWDGNYLAVEAAEGSHSVTIYQISVSGSVGTVVNSTELISPQKPRNGEQFWIHRGRIVRPVGGPHNKQIGFWQYPKGGKAQHFLLKGGSHIGRFGGLTVSVAPSH